MRVRYGISRNDVVMCEIVEDESTGELFAVDQSGIEFLANIADSGERQAFIEGIICGTYVLTRRVLGGGYEDRTNRRR